jgi:DNA-binding response OmpR family regulator
MSIRVLVVEDDALNCAFICAALSANGCLVETAGQYYDLLNLSREFKPDLMILALGLSTAPGIELLELFNAELGMQRPRILCLTAYLGKGEESLLRMAGADELLPKPVSIKALVSAVQKLQIKAR